MGVSLCVIIIFPITSLSLSPLSPLSLSISLSLSLSPELVPHETVVKELVADTVSYDAELGAGGERFSAGTFSQALFITVKVQQQTFLLAGISFRTREDFFATMIKLTASM